MKQGDTIITADGKLAVITRIEDGKVYGLFCMGPLSPMQNMTGRDNEFLLGAVEG